MSVSAPNIIKVLLWTFALVCSTSAWSRNSADFTPGETVFVKGFLGALAASKGVVVRVDASRDAVLVRLLDTSELQWYRPTEVVNRLDRNAEATNQVVRGIDVLSSVLAGSQVGPMNGACKNAFASSNFEPRRASRLCWCMAQRAYVQLNIEEWAHLKRDFARAARQFIEPNRWATVQEPCAVDIEEATEVLDLLVGSSDRPFLAPPPANGVPSAPTVTIAIRNSCQTAILVTLRFGPAYEQLYVPPRSSEPVRRTITINYFDKASPPAWHFRPVATRDATAPPYDESYPRRHDRWSSSELRKLDPSEVGGNFYRATAMC